jgi:hypothetical protein
MISLDIGFSGDEHEPQEILRLLEHTVKPFDIRDHIHLGLPDYVYSGQPCYCHNSEWFITERKTWDDVVNDLPGVEKQLSHYMEMYPEVHKKFYLEGVVEPAMKGILVYKKAQSNMFRAGLRGSQQNTYAAIASWLHQVKKYWDVTQTSSQAETAMCLALDYAADNKVEESHNTFMRMFKERQWKMNPQAELILGASGAVKFGPERAEAVAKHFYTAWRAWKAQPEEWMQIPGIGESTARQYLRNIGRSDV